MKLVGIGFTLVPAGDNTKVTWSLAGKNTFMSKAIGLVMNIDKMVGADFENGLAELKRLAERKVHAVGGRVDLAEREL